MSIEEQSPYLRIAGLGHRLVMASAMPTTPPTASGVNGDTLVIIKVLYAGQNRRFKLALRDLGAESLPQKVCHNLCVSLIRAEADFT